MPYKSEKQRKWMHANKPTIAARWDREAKSGKATKKKRGTKKK